MPRRTGSVSFDDACRGKRRPGLSRSGSCSFRDLRPLRSRVGTFEFDRVACRQVRFDPFVDASADSPVCARHSSTGRTKRHRTRWTRVCRGREIARPPRERRAVQGARSEPWRAVGADPDTGGTTSRQWPRRWFPRCSGHRASRRPNAHRPASRGAYRAPRGPKDTSASTVAEPIQAAGPLRRRRSPGRPRSSQRDRQAWVRRWMYRETMKWSRRTDAAV